MAYFYCGMRTTGKQREKVMNKMNEVSGPADVLAVIPDDLSGMIAVTRDTFFATVGQLNVHPCPTGNWDPVLGYRSEWKMHGGAGEHIATTIGGTSLSNTAYLVAPGFYDRNRAALARVGGAK